MYEVDLLDYVKQIQNETGTARKNAMHQLYIHTYPYLYTMAKKFWNPEMPFELRDLINSGVIGVFEAAMHFDFSFANTFLTYATSYIIKHFDILLEHKYNVWSLPYNSNCKYARFVSAYQAGKDLKQIQTELGLSEDVCNGYRYIYHTFSMNTPIDKNLAMNEGTEFADTIADETVNVCESATQEAWNETIWEHLYSRYSAKDIEVVKLYYNGYTYQEIGAQFGFSRQRSEQIVKKFLKAARKDKTLMRLAAV